MAEPVPAPESARTFGTSRLEAFSDGVYAIAITLLVLDIAVPAVSGDDLFDAILDEWPSYLGYVVSFSTIGALWLAHAAVTEYLDRADSTLVRLNLLLLLVVSFIPFPTRLLADYMGEDDAGRLSTTLYGLTFLVASALTAVLWRYGVRRGLVRPDVADEEIRVVTRRLTPGLAGYLLFIGLGVVLPVVAVLGYLAVALFFMVPYRHVRGRA
jgi:uncharacterized membrane protein